LSELHVTNAPSEIAVRPFPKVVSEFDVKRLVTIISTMQHCNNSWFNSRVVTMVVRFNLLW